MRPLLLVLAIISAGCGTSGGRPGPRAAHAPSLADSADARRAVSQYLEALAARDYAHAAGLFVGEWRAVAAHTLDTVPDTLTVAGFLSTTCSSGFFVCGLHAGPWGEVKWRAPDTLLVSVGYLDSLRQPYRWGPCCGGSAAPESLAVVRTIARDSGYAVVDLPLYIP